jgi:hypothetical protein
MGIGIELARKNSGKTFISLSSGARNSFNIRSAPRYLIEPKVYLGSRECTLPIILSETCDDLDLWHAFIAGEFGEVLLFNFRDFDLFCPIDQPLPTRFAW